MSLLKKGEYMGKLFVILSSVFALSSVFSPASSVNSESNDAASSFNALNNYLNGNQRNIAEVSFGDQELIYDSELNEIGYVHEFIENGNPGYAITLKIGGNYIVGELTHNMENPYDLLNNEGANVYLGPLQYYKTVNEDVLKNVETGETIGASSVTDINLSSMIDSSTVMKLNEINTYASYTTKYVADSSKLEYIAQPNSSTCTPTSAAMVIKYHIARENLYWKNGVSYSSNSDLVYAIESAMNNSTTRGMPSSRVVPGVENFTSNKCTSTLSGTRYQSINSSTYRNAINNNNPTIVTVKWRVAVDPNSSFEYHSLCGYGYKYDSTSGTTYFIGKDPGYPNSAPIREFLFTSTYILEYFTFSL